MAKQKSKINENMDKAIKLTQDTAKATLNGAVETAEVTENYVQNVYKAAYDANVDALKVAKGYWDAVSDIRQDWIKVFASTGESVIDGKVNMEVPYQKEAIDFSKGLFDRAGKMVSGFIPQTKSAK